MQPATCQHAAEARRDAPVGPWHPEPGTGLRLLSSRALGRAAVAGSSAQAPAHGFNSSAQTCCGQPVRPLILFSPGPGAGGKPSCCCCQRTHTREEARETGLDASAPLAQAQSKGRGGVRGAGSSAWGPLNKVTSFCLQNRQTGS